MKINDMLGLYLFVVLFFTNCNDNNSATHNMQKTENDNREKRKEMGMHLTTNDKVLDIVNHPAFKGFGESLLTRDNNSFYYNTPISDIASLMPYHGYVNSNVVVAALNHMIDDVNEGKTIFYNIYNEQEMRQDSNKKNTGIFFYRGKPNAPFAVVCPGGGFAYVGSLHEGFPLAQRISEFGLNAFVIRYRIGSERYAAEDLATAITYIMHNADKLGVSTKDYSVWGGSAGARMAGDIALYGVSAFGGENIPKPATVVIAYTGQSTYSENFPATFITVAANDPIANINVMERRVQNLRQSGVDVEYHRYQTAGHGFGIGTGTDADGWLDLAVEFWKKHINY